MIQKIHKFISNGGWISICVIGAFGVMLAAIGMILTLIDIFKTCDLVTSITMSLFTLLIWGVAGLGIITIIKMIKNNPNTFKVPKNE